MWRCWLPTGQGHNTLSGGCSPAVKAVCRPFCVAPQGGCPRGNERLRGTRVGTHRLPHSSALWALSLPPETCPGSPIPKGASCLAPPALAPPTFFPHNLGKLVWREGLMQELRSGTLLCPCIAPGPMGMPESAELHRRLGPHLLQHKEPPLGPCQDLSQEFASENSWFLLTGEGRAVPGFILPRSSPAHLTSHLLSVILSILLFPFWFLQMQ